MGTWGGILRRGVWCASLRPPLGVRLFLSLFAVSRRFSLQPSCHLAVAPFSSCYPLSLLPPSRRSPCCISWPLESIELSSSKDESSDAHCDHLPPSHIIAQVHFSLRTLEPSRMVPALGSPSGAS